MGELAEDFRLMKEHSQAVREQKEPSRTEYATDKIMELGYVVSWNADDKAISVYAPENRNQLLCRIWPYTGWYSGKSYGFAVRLIKGDL